MILLVVDAIWLDNNPVLKSAETQHLDGFTVHLPIRIQGAVSMSSSCLCAVVVLAWDPAPSDVDMWEDWDGNTPSEVEGELDGVVVSPSGEEVEGAESSAPSGTVKVGMNVLPDIVC